jgi:hypothetical protein
MPIGNPNITQGMLNRVRGHLVVADFPGLAITASNMSRSMIQITFEDDSVDKIKTAVGFVDAPNVFLQTQVVVGILRSQTLSGNWLAQMQQDSSIGQVSIYSDSSVFPTIILTHCSIMHVDPGPYDATNPEVKVIVVGQFNVNNNLWLQS